MTRGKEREENKDIYFIHTNIFITSKEERFMTIIILDSIISHVVIADIFNCLLPLSICPQRAPQLVMVLYLMEWPKPSFQTGSGPLRVLPGLGCCDFPLTLFTDMVLLRDTLRGLLYSKHTYLHCGVAIQVMGSQDQSSQPAHSLPSLSVDLGSQKAQSWSNF